MNFVKKLLLLLHIMLSLSLGAKINVNDSTIEINGDGKLNFQTYTGECDSKLSLKGRIYHQFKNGFKIGFTGLAELESSMFFFLEKEDGVKLELGSTKTANEALIYSLVNFKSDEVLSIKSLLSDKKYKNKKSKLKQKMFSFYTNKFFDFAEIGFSYVPGSHSTEDLMSAVKDKFSNLQKEKNINCINNNNDSSLSLKNCDKKDSVDFLQHLISVAVNYTYKKDNIIFTPFIGCEIGDSGSIDCKIGDSDSITYEYTYVALFDGKTRNFNVNELRKLILLNSGAKVEICNSCFVGNHSIIFRKELGGNFFKLSDIISLSMKHSFNDNDSILLGLEYCINASQSNVLNIISGFHKKFNDQMDCHIELQCIYRDEKQIKFSTGLSLKV